MESTCMWTIFAMSRTNARKGLQYLFKNPKVHFTQHNYFGDSFHAIVRGLIVARRANQHVRNKTLEIEALKRSKKVL